MMLAPRIAKLLDQYDKHVLDLEKIGPVNNQETFEEKQKRKAALLKDFLKFDDHYFGFPGKKPYSKYHKKIIRKFCEDEKCFIVAMCYRGFSKSSLIAKLLVFAHYNKWVRSVGYFSRSNDKAVKLLASVRNIFEKNARLRHDFGAMDSGTKWKDDRFTTKMGCTFSAFGAGQSPRGEKTEDDIRLDCEIFDDFDDTEVCANPDRLDNNWKYVQGDCFGAFSTLGGMPRRKVFLNNKIDEDCIVERANQMAKQSGHGLCLTVNIIDETTGEPMWPEALTREEAKEIILEMGEEADTELFNRPAKKGKMWKREMFQFKKCPALNRYTSIITYLDGGFKKTDNSDTKSLWCIGKMGNEIHVHMVYVDNVTVDEMVEWHYELFDFLSARNAAAIWYMEEVFLLDLLYKDFSEMSLVKGFSIPIQGDKRKKPDKDTRIASTLGYFKRGQIFFDERLKTNPHMTRLIDQYLKFRVGSKTKKDGPDAGEGAIWMLNEHTRVSAPPAYGNPRSRIISKF